MDFFSAFVNMVWSHRFITFMVILGLGLLWIYFEVPEMIRKTAPKGAIQSTEQGDFSFREEWEDSIKSFNRSSLFVFSVGIFFSAILYFSEEKDDILCLIFQSIIVICLITGGIMQILNKFALEKWVYYQGGASK